MAGCKILLNNIFNIRKVVLRLLQIITFGNCSKNNATVTAPVNQVDLIFYRAEDTLHYARERI